MANNVNLGQQLQGFLPNNGYTGNPTQRLPVGVYPGMRNPQVDPRTMGRLPQMGMLAPQMPQMPQLPQMPRPNPMMRQGMPQMPQQLDPRILQMLLGRR